MDNQNDFKELQQAIGRIGKEIEDTAQKLSVHEQVEAVQYKNMENGIASLSESIKEILIEMKNNRNHFDTAINNQQDHVDAKINECHNNLRNHINTNYMTRDAVTVFRDETLNHAKNERRKELKEAVKSLEKKIESNNANVYKSAKSHLTLIWIMVVAFYGLASYIFLDFKEDYKNHEIKYDNLLNKLGKENTPNGRRTIIKEFDNNG